MTSTFNLVRKYKPHNPSTLRKSHFDSSLFLLDATHMQKSQIYLLEWETFAPDDQHWTVIEGVLIYYIQRSRKVSWRPGRGKYFCSYKSEEFSFWLVSYYTLVNKKKLLLLGRQLTFCEHCNIKMDFQGRWWQKILQTLNKRASTLDRLSLNSLVEKTVAAPFIASRALLRRIGL